MIVELVVVITMTIMTVQIIISMVTTKMIIVLIAKVTIWLDNGSVNVQNVSNDDDDDTMVIIIVTTIIKMTMTMIMMK